jgi:hypothetical protein
VAGHQGFPVLTNKYRVIYLIALAGNYSLIWEINFPCIGHKNFEGDFFARVALNYLRILHLQFSHKHRFFLCDFITFKSLSGQRVSSLSLNSLIAVLLLSRLNIAWLIVTLFR